MAGAISPLAKKLCHLQNPNSFYLTKSIKAIGFESDQTAANQVAVNQLPLGSIVVQKAWNDHLSKGQEQVLTVGGPIRQSWNKDMLVGMIAAFAGQFKSSSLFERVAATFLHSLSQTNWFSGSLCRPANGNVESFQGG